MLDGQSAVEELVKHRTSSTASWGGTETVSYLQGPSGPLYRLSSASADPSWYVYDGLGSVVGEVSVTGTLTASESRDVYGNLRNGSGTKTTSHGFVGGLGHQTDDETGLVYMRARYYDPAVGRFISQDPSLHGANWFVYANSNPVNLVDPSGCFPEGWADLIAAMGLGATGMGMLIAVFSFLIPNLKNETAAAGFEALFSAAGATAVLAIAAGILLVGVGAFLAGGAVAEIMDGIRKQQDQTISTGFGAVEKVESIAAQYQVVCAVLAVDNPDD